jgi:hypothetical protein
MTWWADYNILFNDGTAANAGQLDLSAWVSVINQSGASFSEATLKLVAGDVHRAQPAAAPATRMVLQAVAKADAGFEEKAFDEFHLYTLGRPTSLPNNSTKQIELFDRVRQVPAKRLLVLDNTGGPLFGSPYLDRAPRTGGTGKVDTFVEFRNDAASGLGMPLPAGRVRVSRLDAADGSLEFVGEDVIGHTPKDETVRLKLGTAFDVVAERRQVDFAVDTAGKSMEEEFEIRVRNHKAQPVDVQVREPLYRWSNWRIVSRSQEYVKDDARQIHFNVAVPRDGETVLRYRVRYTW